MSRAGRSSTSSITADSTEGQTVAYFTFDELHIGLARGAAAAVRSGVPAKVLAGQSMFVGTDAPVAPPDTLALRRLALEDRAEAAHLRARRALESFLSAQDDEKAKEYKSIENNALADRREALVELADLEKPPLPRPVAPFDALTNIIVPALSRVATCQGDFTVKESHALDQVIPDYRLQRRSDGLYWGTATVLLNTADGVAELGGFDFKAGVGGRGTALLRGQLDNSHLHNEGSRAFLRSTLEEAGVTAGAALTLVNAPLPQLAFAVLHGLVQHEWPDWVSEEWRQPAFVRWVTAVYSDRAFSWLGRGRYLDSAPFRQATLWFASEFGGPFSIADLRTKVPVDRLALLAHLTQVRKTPHGKTSPWYPSLVDVTSAKRFYESSLASAIRCECGAVADHALRAPEVPRALLCDCGQMPDAKEFHMADDVRFPSDYARLKMTFEVAVGVVREQLAARTNAWNGRTKDIILLGPILEDGATQRQIAAAVGGSHASMWQPLETLVQRGMLAKDSSQVPFVFRYTPLGVRKAAQLLGHDEAGSF
jgi:hypothetical protein